MANSFAVFCVLLATFSSTQAYCDFKSRTLHTKISRALVQANRWLIKAQDDSGKWIDLHTTGNVLAVLQMIGNDARQDDTCSNTFKKASQYFTMNKFTMRRAIGGQLAYIIMGLNSLCEDPSNYFGMNLTKRLLEDVNNFPKGVFRHYFQYSLALVTLGINDVRVPWHTVYRLINKIKHILKTKERHSKDTCSLFVMALKSVAEQFKGNPEYFLEINKYINMLTNALAMKTQIDEDNFWTKSLVMQAHSAANRSMPWDTPRCERLYESLLSKKNMDGSFGSLSSVLHVLPSLAGVSFLDLNKGGRCQKIETSEKPEQNVIDVCVKIEFEAINRENPTPQIVTVPKGSTAIEALRVASQLHSCYRFRTKTTAWGDYLTQLCRTPKSDAKKVYWVFYVDEQLATVGIGRHVVKENQCIIFKYKKLNLKK